MNKLNVGCGGRLASGWTHVDFHSRDSRVQRVNLLKGLPYPDGHFDAVYSSHVLEHFTSTQASGLLREMYRVLKPGGIVRVVVPDLEGVCREYLRVLSLPDADESKADKYGWILVELLDQLVRSVPSGEMGPAMARLADSPNRELVSYVRERMGSAALEALRQDSTPGLWRRVTPQALAVWMRYLYVRAVSRLIPRSLREMVFTETDVGERHRWMYDAYGLGRLIEGSGFCCCRAVRADESAISGFGEDGLDCHADGSVYKPNSIYMEALKMAAR